MNTTYHVRILLVITGNCIWYDEPNLWKSIKQLLNKNNTALTSVKYPDLNFPAHITDLAETGRYGASDETSEESPVSEAMLLQKDAVQLAIDIEFQLQDDYWTLSNRWHTK
jgi:hypothetical protein